MPALQAPRPLNSQCSQPVFLSRRSDHNRAEPPRLVAGTMLPTIIMFTKLGYPNLTMADQWRFFAPLMQTRRQGLKLWRVFLATMRRPPLHSSCQLARDPAEFFGKKKRRCGGQARDDEAAGRSQDGCYNFQIKRPLPIPGKRPREFSSAGGRQTLIRTCMFRRNAEAAPSHRRDTKTQPAFGNHSTLDHLLSLR